METKTLNELRHRVERMLAEEMLSYLNMDESVEMQWTDTTLHLVEVIHYLYISDMMCDENGMLMYKKDIASIVFDRMHVSPPCNMSTYLTRVRNIKGKRMLTLLDINMNKMQKLGRFEGLRNRIKMKDREL